MTRTPPGARPFAALVLLVLSVWVWAAEPPPQSGILFEIQAPQAEAPSYLFGTIHSEDPRVLDLPRPVQAAFDASPGFALEVVPDSAAIIKAMVTMTYTDGRTLRDVLPEDLYWRTSDALETRGMTEAAYRDFKPWAVVTLLSVPPAKSGEFLDMRLYRTALDNHKRMQGLETMQEQLAIFDQLNACDQVALLRETLDALDQLPTLIESLTLAYLARDLGALMEKSQAYLAGGDPRLEALFWEAAVDSRNRRMIERIAPLVDEGGWFIAVGALHLPGPGGILNLLERRGYRITLVY